jgi:hypothetical protein
MDRLRHPPRHLAPFIAILAASLLLPAVLLAQDSATRPGVVSHVKIVADKVEDVSSLEAWRNSVIRDDMTDEQKGIAIWETVVKFRHQQNPPHEFLQGQPEDDYVHAHVHDAIKTFNVYGYNQCSCASSNIQQLARHIGMPSQGRIISRHSVPEVFWGGRWRMLDASMVCYFRTEDGEIAGVQEIRDSVAEWEAANPDYDLSWDWLRYQTFTEFFRNNSPTIFLNNEFIGTAGWLPAKTHGWYSLVMAYDGKAWGVMEYGYSEGYQVNVQLRPGERLTRNWFNKGLHVNMHERSKPLPVVDQKVDEWGDLVYSPGFGDLAPGRVGNGTLEYEVPLADGTFRTGALVADNLATRSEQPGPAAQVKDPAQPATLVIRMPSSYIYLDGEVQLEAAIPSDGSITVSISDNNGLDWQNVVTLTQPGAHTIDLMSFIHRRYDYRLRLELSGNGTGLGRLYLTHDVQHSQRPLPALAQGENTITFTAGPPEGTITLEGSTHIREEKKNLYYTDFHPQVNQVGEPCLSVKGERGELTFPIVTPGDMTRIRMGAFYRAREPGDHWDMQVSFDSGETFQTIGRLDQNGHGHSHYVTFEDVPAGTREALVRYAGVQKHETMIIDFRIDADYLEPQGGFARVRVTYVWEEDGQEKRHIHVARSPEETYTIQVAQKPLLKSLIVELE